MTYTGGNAIKERPDGAADAAGLKKLAVKAAEYVKAGVRQREENRKERYDRLRALYLHDAPVPAEMPFVGASKAHLNVMQVKIDALGTNVMRTITSRAPYFVAQTYKQKQQNIVIERVVQEFLDRAFLTDQLAAISSDAGLFNIGVLYDKWCPNGNDYDPVPGIEICPIEIQDHFCYPAGVTDEPWKSKAVGHRIWVRKASLEAKKRSGEYADVKASATGDPQEERQRAEPSVTGFTSHDSAGSNDNDLIPLWWVCFKDFIENDEVWFWGLLSETDAEFLRLERYEATRPPYHVVRYKPTKGEYWSLSSVGNDLQGIQLDINDLLREWMDGIKFNTYGVMVGSSFGRAEAHLKYRPGDFLNQDAESNTQYFNPRADLSYIPGAISMFLGYADQVVRISQESSAGESPGTTATQAAIRQAGMKAGVDDYIGTAGKGCVSLVEHVHELIVLHIDEWYPVLAEYMGLTPEDAETLSLPTAWSLNTNSIGSTPSNQVQVLQMALEAGTTNPQMGFDLRGIGYQILVQAERMGLSGATELQLPETPEQMIQVLAQVTGTDPMILTDAVEQAKQTQQLAAEGEKNERRQKIGESVASGLGIAGEQPGASSGQRAFRSVT